MDFTIFPGSLANPLLPTLDDSQSSLMPPPMFLDPAAFRMAPVGHSPMLSLPQQQLVREAEEPRRTGRTPNWKHAEKKAFLDLILQISPDSFPSDILWEKVSIELHQRTMMEKKSVAQCKQQMRDLKKAFLKAKSLTSTSTSTTTAAATTTSPSSTFGTSSTTYADSIDERNFLLHDEMEAILRRWEGGYDSLDNKAFKQWTNEALAGIIHRLEQHQRQQQQLFQELLDNTGRVLADHVAFEQSQQRQFQNTVLHSLNDIIVRLDVIINNQQGNNNNNNNNNHNNNNSSTDARTSSTLRRSDGPHKRKANDNNNVNEDDDEYEHDQHHQ